MMYFNCMEIGADCDDCDYGQLYRKETGNKCTYEKCAYPERLKSVDFIAAGIALGAIKDENDFIKAGIALGIIKEDNKDEVE